MMKDSKVKDGTKALTQNSGHSLSIKAGKSDVIWSHAEFGRELEKAKQIGADKMSDKDLLRLCRGISGYYHAHFWVDARPFFRELWQRINSGKLRMSKTEVCRRIGCTPQWANAIVSGWSASLPRSAPWNSTSTDPGPMPACSSTSRTGTPVHSA